jgi:hypothetical protein
MSELGELIKQRENSLLTQEFLGSVLTTPKFISNIATMCKHGSSHFSEAAFSVRNIRGIPEISDLQKSSKATDLSSIRKSLSISQRQYNIIGRQNNGEGDFFKDLVLIAHSHPIEKHERPEDFLRPSEADLEVYEQDRIEFGNPFLIDTIVVKKGEVASLLLMQADPSKQQNTQYQQWDEDADSITKLYNLLRESGYRIQIIRVDLKNKKISDEDKKKFLSLSV